MEERTADVRCVEEMCDTRKQKSIEEDYLHLAVVYTAKIRQS